MVCRPRRHYAIAEHVKKGWSRGGLFFKSAALRQPLPSIQDASNGVSPPLREVRTVVPGADVMDDA